MLPALSTAITNAWEPREPEPLLQFLEAWADLLPPAVQRHILDTLVLPKVETLIAQTFMNFMLNVVRQGYAALKRAYTVIREKVQ